LAGLSIEPKEIPNIDDALVVPTPSAVQTWLSTVKTEYKQTRSIISATLLLVLLIICTVHSAPPKKSLEIYFVDVEGGAATLIVTPLGESVLVDSGWPGERDPKRIESVAKGAGLKQIDHYITTHWHRDHFGGIGELVRLIPVKRFYGHGIPDPLPRDIQADLVEAYRRVAGNEVLLKPGDQLQLKSAPEIPRIRFRIVSANGVVTGEKAGGGQIRSCNVGHEPKPEDESDNANSVGFVLEYGRFRFFDGGDLTWNVEHKLVCPVNIPGKVSVFQVNHHGLDNSNNPVLIQALAPQVAIINNGAKKGGQARTYSSLKATPSVEAIFQLHRNVETRPEDNTATELIANDNEACEGRFIQLRVEPNGRSYTVSNPAKGVTRSFKISN
jgi:beta-lactamase superfamily II metal-dependent hydrolase